LTTENQELSTSPVATLPSEAEKSDFQQYLTVISFKQLIFHILLHNELCILV